VLYVLFLPIVRYYNFLGIGERRQRVFVDYYTESSRLNLTARSTI